MSRGGGHTQAGPFQIHGRDTKHDLTEPLVLLGGFAETMSFNLINDSIFTVEETGSETGKCLIQLQQKGPALVGVGKGESESTWKGFSGWKEQLSKAQRLGMWVSVGPLAKACG